MAKGRSSVGVLFTVALLIVLAIQCNYVEGRIYRVGGVQGWGLFSYTKWLSTARFRAGDILVFKYARSVHSVVPVNVNDFKSCRTTGKPLSSGNDRVVLKKGWNYFICGMPGHCFAGMKIKVKAF